MAETLAEESIGGQQPTVGDSLRVQPPETQFSILHSPAAQAPTTAPNNGGFIPQGPLAIETNPFASMSGGSNFWTAAQLAMSGLMQNQNAASQWRALILREHEQRRLNKSAQETQAITAMFGAALASGDPEQLASVTQQFTKIKGLEPETIENMQKYQLSIASKLSGDQEEAKFASAVAQHAPPEFKEAINTLMTSVGGNIKTSDAVKIIKSGMLGEPAKTQHMQGIGMVRIAGSGMFAKEGEEPMKVLAASPDARLKLGETERMALREAGIDPGKWVYVDQIPPEASAAMGRVMTKHDYIPAGTQTDLSRAGIQLRGRTRMDQITSQEWDRLNQSARIERQNQVRSDTEIRLDEQRESRQLTPIGERSMHYLDPVTLQHPSPSTTNGELGALVTGGRYVPIRPADISNIKDMRVRIESLVEMRAIAQRILAVAPGENIITAFKLAIKRGLASDSDAALFRGWGQALGLDIASDFNKGRPSDKDKQAIDGVLPKETDTVKNAMDKIDFIIKRYDRIAAANLGVPLLGTGSKPLLQMQGQYIDRVNQLQEQVTGQATEGTGRSGPKAKPPSWTDKYRR